MHANTSLWVKLRTKKNRPTHFENQIGLKMFIHADENNNIYKVNLAEYETRVVFVLTYFSNCVLDPDNCFLKIILKTL